MTYQLWDLASRNLIDEFVVAAEAFDAARAYLTPDEDGVIVDVALVVYDESDEPSHSIHGSELTAAVFGPGGGETRRPA